MTPRICLRPAALAALVLLGSAGVALAQTGAEWLTPAGTAEATRYSGLSEISSSNVGRLVVEGKFPTGVVGSHQGQPLVVGDTMYIVTPFPNKLIALDLANRGKVRWTYDPGADIYARGVACCDTVNRGAAYADGKIVYNVLDGNTVAVDAATGKELWRTKLADPTTGETLTSAPIIVNGRVLLGNSGAELGVRGWITALRLDTGKQLWKHYNTGPDDDVGITREKFRPFYVKDRGENLGRWSWPGTMWQLGGSTAWGWYSYDKELNLVYYGTANPGVWNPSMRPGDNKWGATIFARDPETGEAHWAYQVTPHESWDYDSISENILADLTVNGKPRKTLVHFDKNGFAYTMDRRTGEVLVAEKYVHVTWAERVDLSSGVPLVNADKWTHQGKITEDICPSALGGKEWTPAAFSPQTQLFYVPAINVCNTMEPLKANYIAGTPFMGMSTELSLPPTPNFGELIAWNAATGTRAWSIPETLPLYGGVLATAGNLIFYGTLDRWFKAVDATTGQVLFSQQLECGITGNPIAFKGPDGKQRIAVYTGLGYLAGGLAGAPCPDLGTSDAEGGTGTRQTMLASMAKLRAQVAAPVKSTAPEPTSGALYVFRLP